MNQPAPPPRRRTRARELALQFLYMHEMRGAEAFEELDPFLERHARGGDRKRRREVLDYTRDLCEGVARNRADIDDWIEAIAENWRLARMAAVDRNVLRLAAYELLHRPDVPYKVVLNEAIELAKRFSTAQSGAFVNGILDRMWALIDLKREGEEAPPPPSPEEVERVRRRGRGASGPVGAAGAEDAEPPAPGATVQPPVPVPRPRRRREETP